MSTPGSSRAPLLSGLVYVLLASFGYSTKAVLIKLGYAYGLHVTPVMLMTLRMGLALPFFIAILLIDNHRTEHPPLTARDLGAILFLGVAGYYLAVYLDFAGLAHINASLERLILLLYPTLVVLLSALVMRRPISRKEWLALLISYLGIVIVFFDEVSLAGAGLVTGSTLIFGSACAFALYLTGSGIMVQRLGAIRFSAMVLIVACCASLIHFAFEFDPQIFSLPPSLYALALLMALLSTVAPAVLMNIGIHRIGSGPAAIISSIGPVMTIVLAWWLLEEQLTLLQMAGALLVMWGAYVAGRR